MQSISLIINDQNHLWCYLLWKSKYIKKCNPKNHIANILLRSGSVLLFITLLRLFLASMDPVKSKKSNPNRLLLIPSIRLLSQTIAIHISTRIAWHRKYGTLSIRKWTPRSWLMGRQDPAKLIHYSDMIRRTLTGKEDFVSISLLMLWENCSGRGKQWLVHSSKFTNKRLQICFLELRLAWGITLREI